MKPYYLLLVMGTTFAVLKYALIPTVRRLMTRTSAKTSIKLNAALACFGWIQGVTLVLMTSAAILCLLLFGIEHFGGKTPDRISRVIHALQSLRQDLVNVSTTWSWMVLILLVFGLLLYAYRRGR